jgi:hypothetical protein
MSNFTWGSYLTTPLPAATEAQIVEVETRLGVRFPEELRRGYKTTGHASIIKRGKFCSSGVTGALAQGGRYLGFMQYLEPLDRLGREAKDITEYVYNIYDRPFVDVIPFAQLGAGGWTCLNYQNDPTRANPEIWEGDMETNATFETFFHKVAGSFDDFIDMLLPDNEIAALGFRV